jgi:hypothetical protein
MIRYLPSEILKKVAPESKIGRALKSNLSLKKTALVNANLFDFLDTKAIARVAAKTVKGYKARVEEDPELKSELASDPAQLVQRVQNEVVWQVKEEIKDIHSGEFYIWLPSDADEPDPEHQLNYGEKFQIGVGEMPGDRYGCRCGMEILVDDSSLDL